MSKRAKSLEPKYRDLLREPERILGMERPIVLHMHRLPWAELRDGDPSEYIAKQRVKVAALSCSGKEMYRRISQGQVVVITDEEERAVAHLVPWHVVWKERENERVNAPGLEGVVWRAVVAYRQAMLRHLLYGTEE